MDLEEKFLQSIEIYSGSILNLHRARVELPNGREAEREIVEHSGGVAVVAGTPDGEIVLVKQFRSPAGEVLLELPAGKLEDGEEPMACAARELKEETGFYGGNFVRICSFYTSPGYSDEVIYLYRAEGCSSGSAELEENEFLEVVLVDPEDIVEIIREGQVRDSKTIIGLLAYLRGDL